MSGDADRFASEKMTPAPYAAFSGNALSTT